MFLPTSARSISTQHGHAIHATCSTSQHEAEQSWKVRAWRPSDASDTARIWSDCLLDAGLTNYQPRRWQSAKSLQSEVAGSLIRLHTRKKQASMKARLIRQEVTCKLGAPMQDLLKRKQQEWESLGPTDDTRELLEYYRWMAKDVKVSKIFECSITYW